MKQILSIFRGFNGIWGLVFFLFQSVIIIEVHSNGEFDWPMSKVKYIEKGGNTFDYYAGYAYFSSDDSKNYSADTKYSLDITRRTIFRYVYLLFYVLIWAYGFYAICNAVSWKKFVNLSDEKQKEAEYPPVKPTLFHILLGFITTMISVYGIYYSWIYVTKFWLQ